MKKYLIVTGALAALVVPSAALAAPVDPADGYIWNESAQEQKQGNQVGELTSQITHNGRWVVQDQIADKGGRSAVVQNVLLLDGLGRLAK